MRPARLLWAQVEAENCNGWGPRASIVAAPVPSEEPVVLTATPLMIGMWCSRAM